MSLVAPDSESAALARYRAVAAQVLSAVSLRRSRFASARRLPWAGGAVRTRSGGRCAARHALLVVGARGQEFAESKRSPRPPARAANVPVTGGVSRAGGRGRWPLPDRSACQSGICASMSRSPVGLRPPALPPWCPPLPAARVRLARRDFSSYEARLNLAGWVGGCQSGYAWRTSDEGRFANRRPGSLTQAEWWTISRRCCWATWTAYDNWHSHTTGRRSSNAGWS